MKDKQISSIQLSSILLLMIIASFSGIGIFSIVKASGIDAYLSIPIAGIIGISYIFIYFYIAGYEPNLQFGEKIMKLFGNKIGFIINIIISCLILTLGINVMFNLTNFIVSQFLPETPNYIVGILFAIIAIYANIKGVETIARTSFILMIFMSLLYLTTVVGLMPGFDKSNLMPFLEYGISRPFHGAFYILTLNLASIFNLLVIPKNQIYDSKNFKKFILIFYLISIVALFIVVFLTLGNLGIHLASIYQYPEYIVLKRLQMFDFIDRIENILTIQFIFGMYVSLCFGIYSVSNILKPHNKSKLLTIFLTVLILVISLTAFSNNTVFNNYTYNIVPYIRIAFIFAMFIIALIIFIKRRLNKKTKKDYYIE